MKLRNRVAIVTGGGRGIGKAFCIGLANEGAKVVVADIDAKTAAATAEELKKQGKEALAIPTDVSDEKGTLEMARKTMEKFGRIDILVNNAAFFADLGQARPLDKISVEEWDKVMAVNLRGLFLCTKAVLPHMQAQGKGKIINISSGTAIRGLKGALHYVTSKAGVIGFTRALSRELAGKNINVNTIAPGLTLSDGVLAGGGFTTPQELAQAKLPRCSQKDIYPADLVGTLVFLASDDSDILYGQTILADGGTAFV